MLLLIKAQHKLFRVFFAEFELGSDPRTQQTGTQKVTVLCAILCFKLFVSSLFYQVECNVTCAFSNGVAYIPGSQCDELGGLTVEVRWPSPDPAFSPGPAPSPERAPPPARTPRSPRAPSRPG